MTVFFVVMIDLIGFGIVLPGLEGFAASLVDETSTPAIKARLAANTMQARAKDVFGVPTFIVNGKYLFWGQDRLDQVASALAGWEPPL